MTRSSNLQVKTLRCTTDCETREKRQGCLTCMVTTLRRQQLLYHSMHELLGQDIVPLPASHSAWSNPKSTAKLGRSQPQRSTHASISSTDSARSQVRRARSPVTRDEPATDVRQKPGRREMRKTTREGSNNHKWHKRFVKNCDDCTNP